MSTTTLDPALRAFLQAGTVIPAHPLALNENRLLDEPMQRQLTRYYMASGAGGIAIGVHSTQFEIRDPSVNLYEKVLRCAAEEIGQAALNRPFLKVAGVVGPTAQAVKEAELALKHGYHLALLSMGGLQGWTEAAILARVQEVADRIPVFGFYLQPSVGGRIFTYQFWQQFAEITNVEAIKVASFNRYQTLDVVRAVAHSSRGNDIALYTGNDDNIIADLVTPYRFTIDGKTVEKNFVGGLLGHWAVWTRKAVELMEEIREYKAQPTAAKAADLLSKGIATTDANAAMFDPANHFHGCIPGIHEILRRQGLMQGTWCLNPQEVLSPGQSDEISRVYADYPFLPDDDFVQQFLSTQAVLT